MLKNLVDVAQTQKKENLFKAPVSHEIVDENIKKEVEKPPIKNRDIENPMFCQEITGGRVLRKVELWFGNPSTGKTTAAKSLAQRLKKENKIKDYVFVNCHEEMTVLSTLKTTKTDANGNWLFVFNKLFDVLTDPLQERYIVIFEEANTMPMSVWKSFQPLLDDTEGDFVFEENTYIKNPNVFFILTLNHSDIGTFAIPDAIKSRAFPLEFEDLDKKRLAEWAGVSIEFLNVLEKIRAMFADLGDLPEFHKDTRQLKNLKGLTREQFKKYFISQLSLHNIYWQEAIALMPEFEDALNKFEKCNS